MMTENDYKLLEHLQARKKRFEDNCISCIHYKATEPCWKADNPEVQAWFNEEGKYTDSKLACPEWYDEY